MTVFSKTGRMPRLRYETLIGYLSADPRVIKPPDDSDVAGTSPANVSTPRTPNPSQPC